MSDEVSGENYARKKKVTPVGSGLASGELSFWCGCCKRLIAIVPTLNAMIHVSFAAFCTECWPHLVLTGPSICHLREDLEPTSTWQEQALHFFHEQNERFLHEVNEAFREDAEEEEP